MRWLAILMLVTVLPTVELGEQAVHVIEHLFEGDSPDHSAHHDESQGDEHGCTGLVHLCNCHQAQVTAAVFAIDMIATETHQAITITGPPTLVDLNTLEPLHRPPIG